MNKSYKILAALLSYPKKELIESLSSISDLIKEEKLFSGSNLKKINELLAYLSSDDLLNLQSEYVSLFDRGRAVSLHLFEHIHGESRDRGQAMVDLSAMYAENGLEINTAELPDYLPLFLEFLSVVDEATAIEYLGEPIDIIGLIGTRLKQKKSPYHVIFSILENLSSKKAKKVTLEKAIVPEQTNKEIDEEWQEPEVTFMANKSPESCGSCSSSSSCH